MENDPKAGFKPLAYLAGMMLAVAAGPVAAQVRTVPAAGTGNPPCEVAAPEQASAFPCGVILFSPDGSDSTSVLSAIARGAGAQVRFEYRAIAGVAATVPNRSVLRSLASSSAKLIPDRRVTALPKPPDKGGGGGDGGGSSQVTPEGVMRIGGPRTPAREVGVAIVDTGLDLSHPDLEGTLGGSCFGAFTAGDCQDRDGHGTHVGGIVGARDNTRDVVGVAPGATLYAVKVLNDSGSGSDATVQAGLDWVWVENGGENAASLKIAVANMSLGRPGSVGDNDLLHGIVTALNAQGVTIVVAAGNDPNVEISQQIPAAYPEVMAIASTTAMTGSNACKRLENPIAADTASYFTTDGAGVAVSAPGEDKENVNRGCLIGSVGILSLKAGGGTTRLSGTSMAAPHVAGVAALLVGKGITDPSVVKQKIRDGASCRLSAPYDSPTSSYSRDGAYEGIVSIAAALGEVLPSCP